jgi:hypothetical protein
MTDPNSSFLSMQLGECPHTALLPLMGAAVHHGGAGKASNTPQTLAGTLADLWAFIVTGTTAAGLVAGLPTFICPFFGDQYFWGKPFHRPSGAFRRGPKSPFLLEQARWCTVPEWACRRCRWMTSPSRSYGERFWQAACLFPQHPGRRDCGGLQANGSLADPLVVATWCFQGLVPEASVAGAGVGGTGYSCPDSGRGWCGERCKCIREAPACPGENPISAVAYRLWN